MTRSGRVSVAVFAVASMLLGACGGGSRGDTDSSSGGDKADPSAEGAKSQQGAEGAKSQQGAEGAKSQQGAEGDESEGAKPGGVLRIGMEAESDGLNPTVNRFAVAGLQMGNAVFDTLAAIDADGDAVPYLAKSFTPNAEFTEWTIELRPGVTFHDGTPLNAAAVVANVTGQANDPLIGRAVKPVLAETNFAEAVGELTVVIRTRKPAAHFATFVTGQLGMVASPAWLEAAKANPDLNQKPIGTGPFKFDSRVKDSKTRFVRNDDWWGTGVVSDGPYLDGIDFFPVPSNARRADQLVAGDLDALHTTDVTTQTRLESESSITRVTDELGEETFIQLNTQKAPFDDARVREALGLATSNDAYNKLINNGKLTLAESMFHPDLKWADPSIKQEYDPARAKEIVAEVCAEKADLCKGGKIVVKYTYASNPENDRIYEVLSQLWKDAFSTEPDPIPQDQFITATALGNYELNLWRQFGSPDPDPDALWIVCSSIGDVSLNWTRFCDPERDQLLDEQRASNDDSARIELWHQIAKTIKDAHTHVFLTHTRWMIASSERVKNICGATADNDAELRCSDNGRFRVPQIWIAS